MEPVPTCVVVLVDHDPTSPEVLEAVRARQAKDPATFLVLIVNPAAHEAHLIHPERHDAVAAMLARAPALVAEIERVTGATVEVQVSIRHDPYDALEELMFARKVDEVMFSLRHHHVAERLHLDFAHRVRHLHVVAVDVGTPQPA